MNTRVRTTLQGMSGPKHDKDNKMEKQQGRQIKESEKESSCRRPSSREKKLALQQDVDKLKRKLRHEENVHRALERAFTRPLGALPRLPPYLPPSTLELLAEVAVLEEEVVRLEEQVVSFRQGLYQEAVNISSSKQNIENAVDLYELYSCRNPKKGHMKSKSQTEGDFATSNVRGSMLGSHSCTTQLASVQIADRSGYPSIHTTNVKRTSIEPHLGLDHSEDGRGKENQFCRNSSTNKRPLQKQTTLKNRTPEKKDLTEQKLMEKHLNPQKLSFECKEIDQDKAEDSAMVESDGKILEGEINNPNKISEELIKCLSNILLQMSSKGRATEPKRVVPKVCDETDSQDPYGVCKEFGKRNIGLYKHFYTIEAALVDPNQRTNAFNLNRNLKFLLEKLSTVDLKGLTHQQKLAFWINIYNSCMMNAFIEHGIPESPQTIVSLMQKALINVGGHSMNAMTIEHFILRLPFHLKYTCSKGGKNDEITLRSIFGLEWSEPLVTFALSCGSWSSPAVRAYTASQVENELDAAKRDYLQAAVGISANKFVIPKLLDWYLLDFAKDFESLLDWVCLQLPDELRKEAVKCLERGKRESLSYLLHVMPYEFSFRYILHQ
ncbi:hypothetical protein Syun_015414 [Stephania yunnanensis]|uniref:DUF547 domain-containing protein n=1 Tax=Stephania yunnanensis TaxID=152371 RepID=A0AAP0JLM7_9MAGN